MIIVNSSVGIINHEGGTTIPIQVTYENTSFQGVLEPQIDDPWLSFREIESGSSGTSFIAYYEFTAEENIEAERLSTVRFECTDRNGEVWNNYTTVMQGSGLWIASPIWKDISYTIKGFESSSYCIMHNGTGIYYGKAVCKPGKGGPVIEINKICQNYLYNTLGDFRWYDDEVVENEGAVQEFTLTNSEGLELMNYRFLMDYGSSWSGQGMYSMSLPVNGHLDPRMKGLFTVYLDYEDEVEYDIHSDIDLTVSPINYEFPTTGGTLALTIESNSDWEIYRPYDATWLHFSATSGHGNTVVTVSADSSDGVYRRYAYCNVHSGVMSKNFFISQDVGVYTKEYLTFNVFSSGVIVWKSVSSVTRDIEYRKNGGQWTTITSSLSSTSFYAANGDKIEFRGWNPSYAQSDIAIYGTFSGSTAGFDVEGNIMSLISGHLYQNLTSITQSYAFKSMFKGTNVRSAEHLILPAVGPHSYSSFFEDSRLSIPPATLPVKTLVNNCYTSMFAGCEYLSEAPVIEATYVGDSACYNMFRYCTGLETPPALPATTIRDFCYNYMFDGCTSLTSAPELPATRLRDYCYNGMFMGCGLIDRAPDLLAPSLATGCYKDMFNGCFSLNYVKCMATTLAAECTDDWLNGVSPDGTFVQAAGMVDWVPGPDGIPYDWEIIEE